MRTSWAFVRASTADPASADEAGIEVADEPGDGGRLVLLVGAVDDADGVAVGSTGSHRRRLAAGGEDVGAGFDDLRRAAMVRREPDDLDAGEPVADVDSRLGSVPLKAKIACAGSPTRNRSS